LIPGQHVVVEHLHATAGDRPHCELTVTGHAKFPNAKHIERDVQRRRHLVRHGHTATWQRQHDNIVAARIALQEIGKGDTRFVPVPKSSSVGCVPDAHRSLVCCKRST